MATTILNTSHIGSRDEREARVGARPAAVRMANLLTVGSPDKALATRCVR